MQRVFVIETPEHWAAAKAIRFEVFVDEQRVPAELELDEFDATAQHWLAVVDAAAVGTARVVVLGDPVAPVWKIGRVAVRAPWRGQGVGMALMQAILDRGAEAGVGESVLESQVHALAFYERLGYVAEGEEYLDAGIPHYKMRRHVPLTPRSKS